MNVPTWGGIIKTKREGVSMRLLEFYKSLFIVLGGIGAVFILSELFLIVRSKIYRRSIYNYLESIFYMGKCNQREGFQPDNHWWYECDGERLKMVIYACNKVFENYIIKDKYLRRIFISPNDLFIKFLKTNNSMNGREKFEIMRDAHKFEIDVPNNKVGVEVINNNAEGKVNTFEKVSFAATILGIIVTIASILFPYLF